MHSEIEFWRYLDLLIQQNRIIIDRPTGTKHPRYNGLFFPVDYGYIERTKSNDGAEVDVWRGSLKELKLDGIFVTVDLVKRDTEVKLLIGCTEEEKEIISNFYSHYEAMASILIKRI
jgi:inorganic pyrophosphatase